MKQLLQNLKTGRTYLEDVPAPAVGSGAVLIRSKCSLVSLGTEKMLVEFGRSNLITKARQQPEKVKMVLEKMRSNGVMPTLEAVFKRLDEPLPLGYSNAGEVIAIGKGLEGGDIKVGDRVVSNGSHAEIVSIPRNLVAKMPDGVDFDEACFTVVGAISLQGVRLANPTLGEHVVVVGLGLVGLLAAELLLACGCEVTGFDFDPSKVEVARLKGVRAIALSPDDDPVEFVMAATGGLGADAVLITASSKSNGIVSQAARMSRKRGRIILVGVVGLELNRAEFYEKELTFQVSCSYGPGRYDEAYENRGRDYPLPFVRWTENRNFQAVLHAMREKRLNVKPLISEIVEFEDFGKVYDDLGSSGKIASVLRYSSETPITRTVHFRGSEFKEGADGLAVVGAGNFTKMTVLPVLKKAAIPVNCIVSSKGVSGSTLARKYGIARSTTDFDSVLEDESIRGVIITTRHNLHASMALMALRAGKHVLVEKPLCLTREELTEFQEFYGSEDGKALPVNNDKPTITVGYNRRFAPHIQKIKALIGEEPHPLNVTVTCNAGFIPSESWVHDPSVGGGRVIGEACHFFDLITFLTGSRVEAVMTSGLGTEQSSRSDNVSVILKYENGSHGVVNYFSNGNTGYSKERVEVFFQGKNLILDNFRSLYGYGFRSFKRLKLRQNKGHREQFKQFASRLADGGAPLIQLGEIMNTAETSIAAVESLLSREWVEIKSR